MDELFWKDDPKFFLDLKMKYCMLLGLLQGMALAGKGGTEEYGKVYEKVSGLIEDMVGEIFNCGWSDEFPSLHDIIKLCDNWLQEQFPVPEVANEDQKTD